MTSSPGSTSARMATASAAKPPLVMATSSGSHAMPVLSDRLLATAILAFGSLNLYANQFRRRGSRWVRSVSTYSAIGHLERVADREVRDFRVLVQLRERAIEEVDERRGCCRAAGRSCRTEVVVIGRPYRWAAAIAPSSTVLGGKSSQYW